MELMDAGCLTEILGPDIDFPESHIAYVCRNVLNALAYLHRNNKLHRDIKSDNVLINSKGEIKLADFGFAVGLTQEENRRKSVVGTPFWMAPEIIQEISYNGKVFLFGGVEIRRTSGLWASRPLSSPRASLHIAIFTPCAFLSPFQVES